MKWLLGFLKNARNKWEIPLSLIASALYAIGLEIWQITGHTVPVISKVLWISDWVKNWVASSEGWYGASEGSSYISLPYVGYSLWWETIACGAMVYTVGKILKWASKREYVSPNDIATNINIGAISGVILGFVGLIFGHIFELFIGVFLIVVYPNAVSIGNSDFALSIGVIVGAVTVLLAGLITGYLTPLTLVITVALVAYQAIRAIHLFCHKSGWASIAKWWQTRQINKIMLRLPSAGIARDVDEIFNELRQELERARTNKLDETELVEFIGKAERTNALLEELRAHLASKHASIYELLIRDQGCQTMSNLESLTGRAQTIIDLSTIAMSLTNQILEGLQAEQSASQLAHKQVESLPQPSLQTPSCATQ